MKRNEEKTLKFTFWKFCVTDRQTDGPRDTPFFRDARTHLKRKLKEVHKITLISLTLRTPFCILKEISTLTSVSVSTNFTMGTDALSRTLNAGREKKNTEMVKFVNTIVHE